MGQGGKLDRDGRYIGGCHRVDWIEVVVATGALIQEARLVTAHAMIERVQAAKGRVWPHGADPYALAAAAYPLAEVFRHS